MVKFAPFDWIVSSDDDFLVKCHKFIITVFCYFLSPVALVAIGVFTTFAATSSPSPSRSTVVGLMGSIATFIFCTVPWLYLRRCKVKKVLNKWTSTHTHAWLLSASILTHVIAITVNVPSLSLSYATTGFCIGICDPTKRKIHLYVLAFFLLWFEYNQDVYLAGYTSLDLRLLGSEEYRILRPVCAILSPVWYGLCVGGLVLIVKEYNKSNEKAKNSVSLCYAVSEKLLSYDIQSAQQLLQEGGGEVDVRLRTALLQMVSNLELFRPHLPEYVWDIVRKQVKKFDSNNSSNSNNSSSTTEAGGVELDGGAVAAVDVAEDDRSKVQNILMVGGGGGAGDDGVSYSSSSLRSMQPEDGSASAPHTEKYVQQGGSGLRQPPTLPTQQRTGGGQTIFLSSSQDSLFQFLPETVPHVFYAIIDFKKDLSLSDSTGVTDFPKPASVRKLVNWAHSHALLTRGFLHCFVGDTIHASWSFHAPTTKPVKYVVNMYNTFNNDHSSGLFISGAISSGVGTSYMAGDRRQAYVLHIPWRDRVRSLFHIARPNCAVLLCQDTYITCTESTNTSSLKFRWIDVIHEVVTYDVLNVFEVMLTPPKTGSMSRSGNNSVNSTLETQTADELYDDNLMVGSDDETQSNKSASYSSVHELTMPTDPVSLALSKCVKGAYPEALKILSDNFFAIPRGAHSTMMTRLERKIKLGIIEAEKSILPTSGVAGGIKPFSAIVEL
eukprot:PhF_6_TR39678/c2_g1_i2/m.58938